MANNRTRYAELSEASKNSPATESVQLVSNQGLIILFIALIFGIWSNITPIIVLLSIFFIAILIAKLWSHYSLRNIDYKRSLERQRAFPGESVKMTASVGNHKLLPLSWLDINDIFPKRLSLISELTNKETNPDSAISLSLPGFKRASWNFHISCNKRGYYTFGPATLSSGDMFGFYPRSKVFERTNHLTVYPRVFPLTSFIPKPRRPLGELKALHRIFQDPTRTIGIRPYSAGDSFNHIHWKATAKHQQLKVKEFEPSTTLQCILCLDVESFSSPTEIGPNTIDIYEWGISTIASIAVNLVDNGYPVGYYINSRIADENSYIKALPGSNYQHVINLLEILAHLSYNVMLPLSSIISREKYNLPWGSTLIFIVADLSPEMTLLLEGLRRSQYQVIVVYVGNNHVNSANKFTSYQVHPRHEIDAPEAIMGLEKLS
jgi:uncharacterized protein (DUF58 family)